MTEPRKWTPPPAEVATLPPVLIPGPHTDDKGDRFEVGSNTFAQAVLDALPPGALYRMERQVGRIEGAAGGMVFRALNDTALRLLIDKHVRLSKWSAVKDDDGKTYRTLAYRPCTKDHAGLVLEEATTHPGTRALKLLVSYPVFLPGIVLAKPGWNDGGVYYDEPPSLTGVTPKPEGALDVLDDLVVDFPFKDEASRQNLYAAMLTLVARPAIEGPIPFFLLMAPLERTGKGKLIDTALGMAIRGTTIPPMQLGRDEAESEKRITAQVLSGTPVLHLDNVPIGELLDSPSLASLATAWPLWSGRKLGKSEIAVLPNRVTVVLSANNPKATGELVKRTVPIHLAPKDDHPELRDSFAHPDCYAYALENRGRVLSALLGIIQAGSDSAFPQVRMGGFERWSKIVMGSLRAAGGTQSMTNYSAWCQSADDQNADIEALVKTWTTSYSGGERTATQILQMAEDLGVFPHVFSKPTHHGKIISLSKLVLIPLTDRPVRGKVVCKSESGSNSTYFLKDLVT